MILPALGGGEFLIRKSQPEDIFVPEEMTEEQQMIRETVRGFVQSEVLPVLDRIEKQEPRNLLWCNI